MKKVIILVLSLLLIPGVEAQIGRLLKESAKQAVKNPKLRDRFSKAVSSELDNIRAEYDSSSFNYAIALNDNAGLFESKEQFERQKKFMIEYAQRKKSEEITPQQRARSWVDRSEIYMQVVNTNLLSAFWLEQKPSMRRLTKLTA